MLGETTPNRRPAKQASWTMAVVDHSHGFRIEWQILIEWAGKAGPFTARLVENILTSKPHPEMGYRSALGLIRLERKHGAERLEAACTRAVRLKLYRFQNVKSMLQSGLDRQPLPELLLMPSPVSMRTFAALDITLPSRLVGRLANAKPSHSGPAPRATPDGDGGSISKATRCA